MHLLELLLLLIELFSFYHSANCKFSLDYFFIDQEPMVEIKQELEIAFAIGTKEKISKWGLSFDRIGLAYVVGQEIQGIRFVFGSVF